jgi:hypothetical protein
MFLKKFLNKFNQKFIDKKNIYIKKINYFKNQFYYIISIYNFFLKKFII